MIATVWLGSCISTQVRYVPCSNVMITGHDSTTLIASTRGRNYQIKQSYAREDPDLTTASILNTNIFGQKWEKKENCENVETSSAGVYQHRCWWLVLLESLGFTMNTAGSDPTFTDKLEWKISAPYCLEWVKYQQFSIKQFLVSLLSESVNVKTGTKIQSSSLSKGSL